MENYWRVQEVAAALKISVQTVYRYVANDEIPFHKIIRAIRFKPSEIESWIESKAAGVPQLVMIENQNGNSNENVKINTQNEMGEV
jgi:excisionase family DNA binding protein